MGSGGIRPGSGRKKGRTSVAPEDKAVVKNVSLRPDEWEALDAVAEQEGLTRSALIRRELSKLFSKYFEKIVEKSS